jgi:hypothetical protein
MQLGFGGTFDKFDEYLKTLRGGARK